MKIRYRHISDPNTDKIHDVEKAWVETRNFVHAITGEKHTLKQFEEQTLKNLERDKRYGVILEYEVI